MLTDSQKFVLDKILYNMTSEFWSIYVESNNLFIKSSLPETIVAQIIFRKIWEQVNTYLNETKTNTINETIQDWNNMLSEKILKLYSDVLIELNKDIELPKNTLTYKGLLLSKNLYMILSSVLNSNLYSNNVFLQNLQLSRSVKFLALTKLISNFLDNNYQLNNIEIIVKIQNNKDQILNRVQTEIIDQLTNNTFKYPSPIDLSLILK